MGNPGHALDRPSSRVYRERGHVDGGRAVLRVAGAARAGRAARRRSGQRVRRHRAPGVPRGRVPGGAAPAARPRHRAPVGADRADVRRGRRPRRPARRGLPGGPARRPLGRAGQRGGDGEALPRRRPAARRGGSAFPAREGAGLPGRHVRVPPAPVPGRDRGRGHPDHARLRRPHRDRLRRGRLRLQRRRHQRAAPHRAWLRRHRLQRLGDHQRPPDHGRAARGQGLGSRAAKPGRADADGRHRRGGPVRRRVPAGDDRRAGAVRPAAGLPGRPVGAAGADGEVPARSVRPPALRGPGTGRTDRREGRLPGGRPAGAERLRHRADQSGPPPASVGAHPALRSGRGPGGGRRLRRRSDRPGPGRPRAAAGLDAVRAAAGPLRVVLPRRPARLRAGPAGGNSRAAERRAHGRGHPPGTPGGHPRDQRGRVRGPGGVRRQRRGAPRRRLRRRRAPGPTADPAARGAWTRCAADGPMCLGSPPTRCSTTGPGFAWVRHARRFRSLSPGFRSAAGRPAPPLR